MNAETNVWFVRAFYDLEQAEQKLRAGYTIDAFLSCHHATELVLKGLVVSRGFPPPRETHDLTTILSEDPSFSIPGEHRELVLEVQRLAESFDSPLTPAPPASGFPRDQVSRLIEKAKALLSWALLNAEST